MSEDFKLYIDKLRSAELRPTRQRLAICKILFAESETFHFTIESLRKVIKKSTYSKVSLATIYNTVHALKKKGYIKKNIYTK